MKFNACARVRGMPKRDEWLGYRISKKKKIKQTKKKESKTEK